MSKISAPAESIFADTNAAAVVVVRALFWDQNAVVDFGAKSIIGFIRQTFATVIVSRAAGWNLNALVGFLTERKAGIAHLATDGAVIGHFIPGSTIAALMGFARHIGSLVSIAVINLREASFSVVRNEISRQAGSACAVIHVNRLAIGYKRQANFSIWRDIISVLANCAFKIFGPFV